METLAYEEAPMLDTNTIENGDFQPEHDIAQSYRFKMLEILEQHCREFCIDENHPLNREVGSNICRADEIIQVTTICRDEGIEPEFHMRALVRKKLAHLLLGLEQPEVKNNFQELICM